MDGILWVVGHPPPFHAQDLALLLGLCAAIAASRALSIRVGTNMRIYLSSVALYLISCLFWAPLAAAAVGGSMLVRELIACRRCTGNRAGVIAAQVGRWMVLSGVVAAIIQPIATTYPLYAGALAGILLWIGDVGTVPIVFCPVTGQRPLQVIAQAARQSYIGEPMQYLIAFFGLAGLRQADVWLDAVYVSLMIACSLLLYLYLREVGQEMLAQADPRPGGAATGSPMEVGTRSSSEPRLT